MRLRGVIRNPKILYVAGVLLLATPSLNLFFNSSCNFFNDYLTCSNNPTQLIKLLNFIYLSIAFTLLSVGYLNLLRSNSKQISVKFIFLITTIFFLTFPFTTTDIFYYKGVAKAEVEKNINPYQGGFDKDIDFLDINGKPMDKPVMYPPGFLFLNKQIYLSAPVNEFSLIYFYKLIATMTFALTYLIIYKYVGSKYANMYALNPLFLFEFVANAHLDVYFIFFITVSILLLLKDKVYISIYSLFLASLVKFNAILIVPVYTIYKLFKNDKLLQYCCSTVAVLLTIFAGCVTILLLYKPYWFGPNTIKGISLQADWPFNSLFERIVFTNLNPYKLTQNYKLVGQSFRDIWLLLVATGALILISHILNNLQLKTNFRKLIKLDFSITKNSALFYSGLLMLIFPIFGLRYFLPWYLTWSSIYFVFSKFKHKNRVLFLQTLIMAAFYPAVYLLGHFNMNVNNTVVNNIRFIFEIILLGLVFYYLFKSKIEILCKK